MTFKEAKDVYWDYYIALEDQFMETSRFVAFDYINNGRTYSMEYLKLFQAVCSEIDVLGKSLASIVAPSFTSTKDTGINEWWYFITQKVLNIEVFKCNLFNEHELVPWKNYKVVKNAKEGAKKYILSDRAKTPQWWTDYNSVKHNRTAKFGRNATNYSKANLRNLFYAFAALYSLEVSLLEVTRCDRNERLKRGSESRLFYNAQPFYTAFLII